MEKDRTMEQHSTTKPIEPSVIDEAALQYQGSIALNDNLNFDKKHFKIKNKVIVEPDMFYAGAFNRLSASALRTLLRCLQKRKWHKVKTNGKKKIVYENAGFIFPYVEAKFLGIGTTQHWKNIKILVEVGFLDVHYQGGWYQQYGKQRDYSIYKLSDRWKLFDTKDFKKVEKPNALNPEFYIRKNLEKQKARATSRKRSGHLHKSEVDRTKQANDRLHKSEVDGTKEGPAARPVNTI
jgi:hypothetical protein